MRQRIATGNLARRQIFARLQPCSGTSHRRRLRRASPRCPNASAAAPPPSAPSARGANCSSAIASREPATLNEVANAARPRRAGGQPLGRRPWSAPGWSSGPHDPDNRRRLALRLSERGPGDAARQAGFARAADRRSSSGSPTASCARSSARSKSSSGFPANNHFDGIADKENGPGLLPGRCAYRLADP